GLRKLMQSELSEKDLKIVRDYGMTRRDAPDLSNPFALFAMLSKRPEPSNKPEIALIYADGMIVDGEGGAGMFADTVGSDEMRKAFRTALRDENIKAAVLRIDSPGG